MTPRPFRRFSLGLRRAGLASGALALLLTGAVSSYAALPGNLNFGLRELAQSYKDSANAAKAKTGSKALSRVAVQSVLTTNPEARADAAGRVITDIYLDGSAPIDDVVTQLESLGCKIESRVDWYGHGALSVWLPLDQAGKAGRMTGVSHVNLAIKPIHHVGKVTSQSGFVLKAEALQGGITATTTPTGSLGSGIMVGAMSDSFNQLKTTGTGTAAAPLYANVKAADDVASYDLPGSATHPYGNTTPVNVLKDYTSSTGVEDEGRGMLQIVHDLVPQATLAFYTADVSEVDFAAGIVALQQAGCNVICDDVGYYDEPMFSDGIVAQAIDKVTAAGATYFSSAGNDDSSGYTATYQPGEQRHDRPGLSDGPGRDVFRPEHRREGGHHRLPFLRHQSRTAPRSWCRTSAFPAPSADATGKLEFPVG